MSTTQRVILACLGVVALVAAVLGALAAYHWDDVSDALEEQSERTRVSLFRLGELMSIGAELERRYGAEPDMTYQVIEGSRILRIKFNSYRLPEETTAQDHAHEIAAFAVGSTTKRDEIDVVEVLFDAAGDSPPTRFELDEL